MALLEVTDLQKSFGSVTAARDINVNVSERETIGIIGANGAGKTTFVNIITGYIKPSGGTILFDGRNITPLSPREITNIGICRSFQVPQVFLSASVFDNILIALGIAREDRFPFWRPLRRRDLIEVAEGILEQYQIADHRDQIAGLLPQGTRKLLDIAMATVHRPRLLLLDEPTSGISVEEKFDLMDIVMEALRRENVTVMFVEHDMDIVGRFADRIFAFYDGTIISEGAPEKVLSDEKVREHVVGSDLHRKPGSRHEVGHA